MVNIEYYDSLKFIDDVLELAKSIPRYFSRFSNKIYCNHQKFAIIILMQKLKTILSTKTRLSPRHDTIDFKGLLKDLKLDYVVADKGYNSKKNRRYVINKLKAIPVIPVRTHTNFYGYIKKSRKIDGSNYHQRSKVESVFSSIKRKYGSVLRGKSFNTQHVEAISKAIAHNVDRMQNYSYCLFKDCTRALKKR